MKYLKTAWVGYKRGAVGTFLLSSATFERPSMKGDYAGFGNAAMIGVSFMVAVTWPVTVPAWGLTSLCDYYKIC